MLNLIDWRVSEERRKELERRVGQARLISEILAVQKAHRAIFYRVMLAKVGTWLTQWGEYLKTQYGEPEQSNRVSVRTKTV